MSDESIRIGWYSPAKGNTSLSGSGSETLWSSRYYKENKEYIHMIHNINNYSYYLVLL